MKKPIITLAVSTIVGIGTVFGGVSFKTEAASLSSLKDQQDKIHNQRSSVNSTINQAKQKIDSLQGQQVDVKTEMKRIDLAIGDTNTKIREKQAKVDDTKAQIAKLQSDIKVIQERIKKRNDLLKERARNYQETGGMVNYLEVLMGSQSFSDFIDRANAVSTIMEADQEILKQADADKKELETKQAQVEKELSSLQSMLKELQNMNQQLNGQRAEKDKLLGSLQAQEQHVQEDVMNMEEQNQVLASQEASIQKAIQMEQQRQAELARQQAAAQASQSKGSSGGGSSASSAAPPVTGGSFMRPAVGPISSTYGPRWGEFHYGVDIANPGANVPIVAAADGVVAVSHYSQSYGNVVYITHSINGHIYTTVYAHMQVRMVSEGQVVSKGQQVGIMGSTGEATGQHLHFELYNGPWKYHSAINPMGIVPL
ncbi:murein hydrolase activator EnvC family protein [Neobacillus ginsengisoli]|uniref:Peptidoglycan hydrolase CwlO-like protein n=1 Tax=Neobacillus ginsengisoli TaxID=904295 RepID=A0ABT9XU17_9BACI|nr:peptidoglycan DD-metalloendopeptidase family protein [Neobacillus ginsengisoli]MDQ0199045.1 peptidoglycan hydrolase CwlO-like protein [Neobacillus ginsengisoli]